jgi:hypothetical protein
MSILVDYIISDIRSNTDNEEFDSIVGYKDEELIRFINDGQNRLHAKILAQHSTAFMQEIIIPTTAGGETYSLPYNTFLDNKISGVEWSSDSLSTNYYTLKRVSYKLRAPGAIGNPGEYSFKNGVIYLNPLPTSNSGSIRISYIRKPKQLNKRRGTIISTSQCSDSLTAPTFIYINYSDATNDPVELARNTKFSVVDKYGNIVMSNVILSSIGAAGSTGDATSYDAKLNIDSSTIFNSGDVIAQGYYIVPGAYSTTHLDVNETIERYIRCYGEWKVFKRDSSSDATETMQELGEMEKEILASYADTSDDIDFIPEINENWTGWTF